MGTAVKVATVRGPVGWLTMAVRPNGELNVKPPTVAENGMLRTSPSGAVDHDRARVRSWLREVVAAHDVELGTAGARDRSAGRRCSIAPIDLHDIGAGIGGFRGVWVLKHGENVAGARGPGGVVLRCC